MGNRAAWATRVIRFIRTTRAIRVTMALKVRLGGWWVRVRRLDKPAKTILTKVQVSGGDVIRFLVSKYKP